MFNNEVSFSFCAQEIAEVLGINNTGTSLVYTKAHEFPEFLFDLKEEFCSDRSRKITTANIRTFLEKMTIEDEQSRSNFKQLLTYFLIEQFVLCSLDPKKPRVASWGMVEKMNALEEVNWAKVIFDNTCDSFRKLKNEIDKGDGKQHYFYGCAPAFEVIISI